MTLRQKMRLLIAVLAAGAILVFFVEWLGGLLLAAGLVLDVVWIRCPHCGTWLGKYPGEYCSSCGEKIPWKENPSP